MHRPLTTLCLAITLLATACERQAPAPAVDPARGLACFETLRATLPPGTQYEGIDRLEGNRLSIRIMNGVDVVTASCTLMPDGTVQAAAQ